jgi:Formyl transferase
MGRIREWVAKCRDGAYLRAGNLQVALSQVYDTGRNRFAGYSDQDHLRAAASWLARAQDVTGDAGFSGRYKLRTGWTSSYPETTGYIVPTLLKLQRELPDGGGFRDRARRAIEFLLGCQLPNGAFPGLEIAENRTQPSPFNTAQVMHGLQAWARETGEERCVAALRRAGDWLCDVQDSDGAWRRHLYLGVSSTYSAHLTCWLAEAGAWLRNGRFLEAAAKHLDWVLQHFDAGRNWFDLCGFTQEDHRSRRAVTHTIAYTIWGVLRTAEVLDRRDGQAAAEAAAWAVARRLELSRWLPGTLDCRWHGVSSFACLTGNAQMALIWMHVYKKNGDPRLLNAALKAIDLVKEAQPMSGGPEAILGGIAGSFPVWGDYMPHTYPNWAVKYFVDALLAKRHALENPAPFDARPPLVEDVAIVLPPTAEAAPERKIRVALLTNPRWNKAAELLRAWSAWNFRPDLLIAERVPQAPLWHRLRRRIAEGRIPGGHYPARTSVPASPPKGPGLEELCRRWQVPLREVPSVNSPEAVQLVREARIDLLVHAGAGILREAIIQAAPLGVLNAHMGLLPAYRGMNVAEWAAWNGDQTGCTVHLIDGGIDTGDILLTRTVDTAAAAEIVHLRELINQAQIELLGEVLRYVLETGRLPPRRPQTATEGLQYFTMHPLLAERLNQRLATGITCRVAGA